MPLSASTSSAALSTRCLACSPRRRGPGGDTSAGADPDDEEVARRGERLWVTVFPFLDRYVIVPMRDRAGSVSIVAMQRTTDMTEPRAQTLRFQGAANTITRALLRVP